MKVRRGQIIHRETKTANLRYEAEKPTSDDLGGEVGGGAVESRAA